MYLVMGVSDPVHAICASNSLRLSSTFDYICAHSCMNAPFRPYVRTSTRPTFMSGSAHETLDIIDKILQILTRNMCFCIANMFSLSRIIFEVLHRHDLYLHNAVFPKTYLEFIE